MRKKYENIKFGLSKKQDKHYTILLFMFCILLSNVFTKEFPMGLMFSVVIIAFTDAILGLRRNFFKIFEVCMFVVLFLLIIEKL